MNLSMVVMRSNISERGEENSQLYSSINIDISIINSYLDIQVVLTHSWIKQNRTFQDNLSHPQLISKKIRGLLQIIKLEKQTAKLVH